MKQIIFSSIFLAAAALFSPCQAQTTPPAMGKLTTDEDRQSYAMGMYFGQMVKRTGLDINMDLVTQGLNDAVSGNPPLLTEAEMKGILTQLQRAVMINRQKQMALESQTNRVQGETFLAQNKTQPGVVTLPDGLQYKIITEGKGESPKASDIVSVNYRGTFIDGTEFDSSAKTGHPAQFPVGRVIRGWTEALEKMSVGSKWEVYVPSDLAYGSNGRPPMIGPNQTLVFEVELLSISHPTPPAPLTSDIIRVPSQQEMKNGEQVETIKASDLQKMQQSATNQ
jgi:FKBP-type peptidyl-prolyl cis-trans isomerase FklB